MHLHDQMSGWLRHCYNRDNLDFIKTKLRQILIHCIKYSCKIEVYFSNLLLGTQHKKRRRETNEVEMPEENHPDKPVNVKSLYHY